MRVAQVACFLAKALKAKGFTLDLKLVLASSLLHDITKMDSITKGLDHAMTGYRLLMDLGYPRVAELVRQHVYLDQEPNPRLNEAHILSYSDKRVLHTQVVDLDVRLDDLIRRYGTTKERRARITKGMEEARSLEKIIFSTLGLYPSYLNRLNKESSSFDLLDRGMKVDDLK